MQQDRFRTYTPMSDGPRYVAICILRLALECDWVRGRVTYRDARHLNNDGYFLSLPQPTRSEGRSSPCAACRPRRCRTRGSRTHSQKSSWWQTLPIKQYIIFLLKFVNPLPASINYVSQIVKLSFNGKSDLNIQAFIKKSPFFVSK